MIDRLRTRSVRPWIGMCQSRITPVSHIQEPGAFNKSNNPHLLFTMSLRTVVNDLIHSPNAIAAGVGEVLQAFVTASAEYPSTPIMIEYGQRSMALGRKRMAAMNGRVSFQIALQPEDLTTDC